MLAVCAAALIFSALGFAPRAAASFGFDRVDVRFTDEQGFMLTQAGAYPSAWTTEFSLNTTAGGLPDGELRRLRIRLPPGLVGNLATLPRCSRAQFDGESCPPATAFGGITLTVAGLGQIEVPLYNLMPFPGAVGSLGFAADGKQVLLGLAVSPQPPHQVVVSLAAPPAFSLLDASIEIPGGVVLPRSCTGPLAVTFEAASEQEPERWVTATATTHDNAVQPNPVGLSGCDLLSFSPLLAVRPTADVAGAPVGLDVSLETPNRGLEAPGALSEADLRRVRLTLPGGVAINPSVAAGLGGCSAADYREEALESRPGQGCPEDSKLGEVEARSPTLDQALLGAVYVAAEPQPSGAAGDPIYPLYFVLRNESLGILVKQVAEVAPDPATGQIVATIGDLPEFPLSQVELHLRQGPRAPLAMPSRCGPLSAAYALDSSAGAVQQGEAPFSTAVACTSSGFAPTLSAGTVNPRAGAASPLVLDLRREASEPDLAALELTLPPGLVADLAGVAACPEGLTTSGRCPASSQVGYARVAVGPGPQPLWIPEAGKPASSLFLAGPYRGAPFSLLIVVPAEAGPFDLGTVVLRAPLRIDPATAQATVGLAGLPGILRGVPLRYRTIRFVLDRPGFVRNPTSCEPLRTALEATATDGGTADVVARFQAADCAALGFKPRVGVRLAGAIGRNGHPRVEARLATRPGQANLAAATVVLPRGELLATRHLRALCDRGLAPSRCPATSRLGRATIRTPLLPQPLRGPVYLRAPSHRYPDLIAAVEGGGVRLVLHGRTGSTRDGRLRFRLVGLPDLPLSRAEVVLAGGRRGIVVNSRPLCGRHRRGFALFKGQNGKRATARPVLKLAGCTSHHRRANR